MFSKRSKDINFEKILRRKSRFCLVFSEIKNSVNKIFEGSLKSSINNFFKIFFPINEYISCILALGNLYKINAYITLHMYFNSTGMITLLICSKIISKNSIIFLIFLL